MRVMLCLAAVALAGCSTFSSVGQAWTGDPAGQQAPVRQNLTPEQVAALTNEVAGLQLQRDEIRGRISGEADMWRRQDLYEDLHGVGQRLSPLERRLAAAAPAR
ncbi:MAG: hypothetical protein ABI907_01875 [Ramlibacter sp.]